MSKSVQITDKEGAVHKFRCSAINYVRTPEKNTHISRDAFGTEKGKVDTYIIYVDTLGNWLNLEFDTEEAAIGAYTKLSEAMDNEQ